MRWVLVVAALAVGCGFEPTGGAPIGLSEPVDAADAGDPDGTPEADAVADAAAPSDAPTAVDASAPAIDAAPSDDATAPVEVCDNGTDDDGDGAPDCRDDDCGACPGVTSCCSTGVCALVCVE